MGNEQICKLSVKNNLHKETRDVISGFDAPLKILYFIWSNRTSYLRMRYLPATGRLFRIRTSG